MKWTNPAKSGQTGIKRSAADRDDIPDSEQLPVCPSMPIIYKDDNFLVVNKPWDVRMDGEHEVTVESLALTWLASIGAPAASCHVPGWKNGAVACNSSAVGGHVVGESADSSTATNASQEPRKMPHVHNSGMPGVDNGPAPPLLRFAHRLDYATSGVLLTALNRKVKVAHLTLPLQLL